MANTLKAYNAAREAYAALGTDTDAALKRLDGIQVSLNCWQGDDVAGFEGKGNAVSDGGILSTGSYPGRARNADELRQDIEMAMSLIPGKHRVNLHAIYAESETKLPGRNKLTAANFSRWMDWARDKGYALDFNPTFFSHPMAATGFTLSSTDKKVREFWIEHAKRSREIADAMGRTQGSPCVNNLWIPDGSKDSTVSRFLHRQILRDTLDEIYKTHYEPSFVADFVESKVFGIGSESYVVGSHEFYMAYACDKDLSICLDMGHFHPTESIADKISAILNFKDRLLLHVSRPVRWDSDHVVTLGDELIAVAQEVARADAFNSTFFAVDFFDGSINRITAWAVGMRNTLKAVLAALLEPTELLRKYEAEGNFGSRLAILEECRTMPFSAVWDMFCEQNNVPQGAEWLKLTENYEEKVLKKRGV